MVMHAQHRGTSGCKGWEGYGRLHINARMLRPQLAALHRCTVIGVPDMISVVWGELLEPRCVAHLLHVVRCNNGRSPQHTVQHVH
eukprot:208491-Chlamydomonas_euryale.AAC.3